MLSLRLLAVISTIAVGLLSACAAPVQDQLVPTPQARVALNAEVVDLRAENWKTTHVLQTSSGVVQHLGDDRFPGSSLPGYIGQQLADLLNRQGVKRIRVKTTDVRLSIPGARVDPVQSVAVAAATGTTSLIAAPMVGLLSTMERNKTASAVLCVSIDGRDFLGNDGRLFAFGAEGELRSSLAAAIAKLRKNIESGVSSNSPACEPGWEGGQPR